MTVRVQPERIFTGIYFGHGRLLNEVESELWICEHRHQTKDTARRCAERERRRWIRDGRGRA